MAKTLEEANAEIADLKTENERLTLLVEDKDSQLTEARAQLTAINLDVESIKQSVLAEGASVRNNAEGRPQIYLENFVRKEGKAKS